MRSQGARSFPTVGHIALLLPWVTAVVAARLPTRDNSFLWHVAAGRVQIESGAVITSDPFSFTFLGEPWRTQSWLLELAYGWLDARWGLGFVTPFVLVCAVLVFGSVLLVTYRMTRSVMATAGIGVLTAWLSAAFLSPRPVLVSYLLLGLVVAAATSSRLRWSLPVLSWIWAGIHGSFILGIGYLVLVALRQRKSRHLIDAGAMAVAASLTAHGLGVWQVLIEFLGNRDALDLITEWATPDLTGLALLPFLVGIGLLLVAGTRGRLETADLLIVVPFLVFGVTATRAVLPAWIVLAPFVGLAFQGLMPERSSAARDRRVLTAIGLALFVFPFLLPVKGESRLAEEFPVAAAEAITADRVFHDDYSGGYLIYRYGPERLVFVDDRAELYGADHLRSMSQARNGMPVWEEVFVDWEIEQVLVGASDPLRETLQQDGWITRFEDDRWLVLDAPRS